jgi:hypothetical protein
MNLAPLALAFCLAASPLLAQDTAEFAYWGENSGSLPPEYAWDYTVTFTADRKAEVRYCKGYATTAPGCATTKFRLSKRKFAALQTALAPLEADLAANPAKDDPNPPVGGGSVYGKLSMNGHEVSLHAFPMAEDAARVGAVLDLLRENTPKTAISNAKTAAKRP